MSLFFGTGNGVDEILTLIMESLRSQTRSNSQVPNERHVLKKTFTVGSVEEENSLSAFRLSKLGAGPLGALKAVKGSKSKVFQVEKVYILPLISASFKIDLEMENLSEAEDVKFPEVYARRGLKNTRLGRSCTRTCMTVSIKLRSLKAVGGWEDRLL